MTARKSLVNGDYKRNYHSRAESPRHPESPGSCAGRALSLALLGASGDKLANRLLAALTLSISIVVSGAVLLF